MKTKTFSIILTFTIYFIFAFSAILLIANNENSYDTNLNKTSSISSADPNNLDSPCFGSGNPNPPCICYYETYCVYVTGTTLCTNGTLPVCP